MPHDLQEIKKSWDYLGKTDPFYAIKVGVMKKTGEWESKEGGKWTREDFFQTGIDEVEAVMQQADNQHITISHKRALDFGCGVGRITQALCRYFDVVDGIDIAPSMIELAGLYNSYGGKVHYQINNSKSLEIFEDNTFDFIYSVEVLQHMHPEYQENYLKEFLRILSPGGLLVFELPSQYANLKQRILFNFLLQDIPFLHKFYWKRINRHPYFADIQYYCNPRRNIETFLMRHGAKKVTAIRNWRSIISYDYFVTK